MIQPKRNSLSGTSLRSHNVLLLVLMLAGFALRLYRLGADSLWYDETVSAFLAVEPVSDLVAHTARDIHPPGYYLFLHIWTLAAGQTEFALAFFSLIFGLLLIPLTYRLARRLADARTATWTVLLLTFSPYHIWYAQEVRMYTLGAALGVGAAYCGLHALARPSRYRYWLGYLAAAVLGLYILYYFVFLLIIINSFFLLYALYPRVKGLVLRRLIGVNILVLVAYVPWLPVAWRQATEPPVPPWRTVTDFSPWPVLLESWSALSLGQSVEPALVWPILLLTLPVFILGLLYLYYNEPPATLGLGLGIRRFFSLFFIPKSPNPGENLSRNPDTLNLPTFQPSNLPPLHSPTLFLVAFTFGPLLLIYLLSFITPLYHVRYLFTYSPAFYIVLAAGFAWLTARRWTWVVVAGAGLLLAGCFFSLYQFHFNPRYRADDYRAAVAFIDHHWQPDDVILVNAGYVYPAFLYYTDLPNLQRRRLVPYNPPADPAQPLLLQTGSVEGSPQLGWGDPRSDFYAMSTADTLTALDALAPDFTRLWLLRAYDTVTDPTGLIRTWLAEHAIPLEDEAFSGESSIRAQGFLLPGAETSPPGGETVQFDDGMTLAGWSLPDHPWQAGQTIPVKLWWRADSRPATDYKMSLKLWTPGVELAAQGQDTWPAGTLYRSTTWPIGQTVYQAAGITLPADLAAGQYWLNVELYHPDSGLPLPRLDGADPVVTLGPVLVQN